MSHFETLHDLLAEQLQDLYDAENQLVEVLPRMAAAASNEDLRKAFDDHFVETREHIGRLREAMSNIGVDVVRKPCKAMAGLIREAEEIFTATGDAHVIDAALIAAAQRIEHYEIAAYGCVKAFAKRDGHDNIVSLMEASAKEEGAANKYLTKLAEGSLLHRSLNKEAAKS